MDKMVKFLDGKLVQIIGLLCESRKPEFDTVNIHGNRKEQILTYYLLTFMRTHVCAFKHIEKNKWEKNVKYVRKDIIL